MLLVARVYYHSERVAGSQVGSGEGTAALRRATSGGAWCLRRPRTSPPGLRRLERALDRRFSEARLDVGRQRTHDDVDFDELLPTIAAWTPWVGADVIRRLLRAFPRWVANGEPVRSRVMRQHGVLVRGQERTAIRRAIAALEAKSGGLAWDWARLAIMLMPGMSTERRIQLVLDHPGNKEPSLLPCLFHSFLRPRTPHTKERGRAQDGGECC